MTDLLATYWQYLANDRPLEECLAKLDEIEASLTVDSMPERYKIENERMRIKGR